MKTKILKLRVKEKEEVKPKISKIPIKPKKGFQNIGGFLFNPPKTCPQIKVSKDGCYWTDFMHCMYCEKKCKENINFLKMSLKDRDIWLAKQGVNMYVNEKGEIKGDLK